MAKEKSQKKKRPTALKRCLQNEKKNLRNRVFKSRVRTAVRSFEEKLKAKDTDGAKEQLKTVHSFMDKGVKIGVYKTNKAARVKSRFTARLGS